MSLPLVLVAALEVVVGGGGALRRGLAVIVHDVAGSFEVIMADVESFVDTAGAAACGGGSIDTDDCVLSSQPLPLLICCSGTAEEPTDPPFTVMALSVVVVVVIGPHSISMASAS